MGSITAFISEQIANVKFRINRLKISTFDGGYISSRGPHCGLTFPATDGKERPFSQEEYI